MIVTKGLIFQLIQKKVRGIMKNRLGTKISLLFITIACLIFVTNLLLPRQVSFFLFTEDKINNEIEIQVFLNDRKEFEGVVGYQVFGKKEFKANLKGGRNEISIFLNNDTILKKHFFLFGSRYYAITFWDVDKKDIKINGFISAFYFE